MVNHPNRTKKTFTLRELMAETYTADEPKWFGFADRGNGCGFGEPGRSLRYDDDADQAYGDIKLTACTPIKANGADVEFVYKSRWQDGQNGYQFRVLF